MSQTTQLVAVTRENHQTQAWNPPTNHRYAAQASLATLVMREVAKACSCMPVVIQKLEKGWVVAGVMSVQPGLNLMVDPSNGQWMGRYVPTVIRLFPFRMAKPAVGAEPVLCIQETPGMVVPREQGGQPFFDDGGKPSTAFSEMATALVLMERDRAATEKAAAALAEADLLKPLDLQVRLPDGTVQPGLTGLYAVDEAKLKALDAARFEALRHNGALPLAYMQMVSMQQFDTLQELAQRWTQGLEKAQADAASALPQDEVIRFS